MIEMPKTNEEGWDEREFPLPRKYYLLLDKFYRDRADKKLKKEKKKKEKNVII